MGLKTADKFLLFWAGLGAIALILIWHLPWRFQVNDDEIMMWLVSGAYTGTPESYAVFIHPILSGCFSKLYTVAPAVKWYPACWFLVMYLSYLGYLKLIWSKIQDPVSALLWALFALCFLVHFLFFLQFSIVAAFAISAGLANRFGRDSLGKSSFFGCYATDVLLILGFLIRSEILFLFLAAYLVLSVLMVRNFPLLRRLVLPALILVVGYGVSQAWIVQSDLGEFQRVNRLRSQVFDHPVLQLNKEEFRESDPELYYFANGLMDFGRESELPGKLEVWKKALDAKRFNVIDIGQLVSSFTYYLYYGRFFTLLMMAFIGFSILSHWRLGLQMLTLLLVGMVLLSPFFLIKIQIYVLVFLVYFSFFLIQSDKKGNRKVPLFGLLGVLSVSLFYHLFSFTRSFQNELTVEPIQSEIRSLREAGIEEIYLISAGHSFGNFYFDRPLNFKKMGWVTLFDSSVDTDCSQLRAYLMDSTVYADNKGYFVSDLQKPTVKGLVLLYSKR